MKKLFWTFLGGFVFGIVVFSSLAPGAIAWYFEPPVEIGVNCRPAVEWALDRFLWMQWGGSLLIGLLTVVVLLLIRAKQKPKAA